MGRVIIIDPGCVDLKGHHAANLKLLERALAPVSPWFVIHAKASAKIDLPEDRCLRFFERNSYFFVNGRSGEGAAVKKGLIFVGPLATLAEDLDLTEDDHLVVPTATSDLVLSCLEMIRARAPGRRPRLHLRVLWYNLSGKDELVGTAFKAIKVAQQNGARVHLYAMTRALKQYLIDDFGLGPIDVALLRFPFAIHVRRQRQDGGALFISSLGSARDEKGCNRIPRIFAKVEEINARQAAPLDLRYLFHLADVPNHDARLRRAVSRQMGEVEGKLSYLSGGLSFGDFAAAMAQTACLLLPYNVERYALRASGIQLDGVLMDVPSIVQKGTAAEEFIRWGNGLTAETDQEFAAAVMEVLQNRATFQKAARRASDVMSNEWRHNPLVERLLQSA